MQIVATSTEHLKLYLNVVTVNVEANPGLNLDPLMSSQVECYPGSDPGLLMELESDEISL